MSTLSACSALNPYLVPPSPQAAHGDTLAGNLDASLREANALTTKYYNAIATQSYVKNAAALTLIPLGAAALGVGATDGGTAGRNLLLGLGLGGAATYATANYVVIPSRQLIWIKGAEALACARRSMWPVTMSIVDRQQLGSEIDALASALAEAQLSIPSPRPDQAVVINQAAAILTAARSWASQIDQSGQTLDYRVQAIGGSVNEQIAATDPDLSAIQTAAGSLPNLATKFAPQPSATTAVEPITGGLKSGAVPAVDQEAILDSLRASVVPLASAIDQARAAVAATTQPDPCLPHAPGAPKLLIGRNGVTLHAGDTLDLSVAYTGTPPRAATSSDDDITTTLTSVNAVYQVHIVTVAAMLPGSYTIGLYDQKGDETDETTLAVIAPTSAPSAPPPRNGTGRQADAVSHSGCAPSVTAADYAALGLSGGCPDFRVIVESLTAAGAVGLTTVTSPKDGSFIAAVETFKAAHMPGVQIDGQVTTPFREELASVVEGAPNSTPGTKHPAGPPALPPAAGVAPPSAASPAQPTPTSPAGANGPQPAGPPKQG